MLDDSLSAYFQDTLVSTDTVCVHQKQVHARLAYLQSRIQSARALRPHALRPYLHLPLGRILVPTPYASARYSWQPFYRRLVLYLSALQSPRY